VSIEKDIKRYADRLSSYKDRDVKQAAATALSKTAAKAKTRTIRGVSKSAKLPAKIIRRKIYVKKAKVSRLRAALKVYRNPVSLMSLKPKQTARKRKNGGVRAGKHFVRGAFIVNGKQVFKRRGKARLPIDVQRIRIQRIVEEVSITVSKRVLKQEFKRLMLHELKFRLSKHTSRG
jgi:hypothetical protein